jgi:hypothetical protein
MGIQRTLYNQLDNPCRRNILFFSILTKASDELLNKHYYIREYGKIYL